MYPDGEAVRTKVNRLRPPWLGSSLSSPLSPRQSSLRPSSSLAPSELQVSRVFSMHGCPAALCCSPSLAPFLSAGRPPHVARLPAFPFRFSCVLTFLVLLRLAYLVLCFAVRFLADSAVLRKAPSNLKGWVMCCLLGAAWLLAELADDGGHDGRVLGGRLLFYAASAATVAQQSRVARGGAPSTPHRFSTACTAFSAPSNESDYAGMHGTRCTPDASHAPPAPPRQQAPRRRPMRASERARRRAPSSQAGRGYHHIARSAHFKNIWYTGLAFSL